MSINSINGSVSLGVPPQVDEEGNVITQDPDSDIKDPSAIKTDKVNTPDSETIDEDIAFKGSIQFRFALYQLNYANQGQRLGRPRGGRELYENAQARHEREREQLLER